MATARRFCRPHFYYLDMHVTINLFMFCLTRSFWSWQQYKVILLGDGTVGKTSIAMRFTNDQFGQQYKQVIYRTAIFDDSLRKNCCGIETDAHYSTYENVGSWVLFLQTIGLDFMLKRLVLPGNTHVALQARSDLWTVQNTPYFILFCITRPHITRRINSPKIS